MMLSKITRGFERRVKWYFS